MASISSCTRPTPTQVAQRRRSAGNAQHRALGTAAFAQQDVRRLDNGGIAPFAARHLSAGLARQQPRPSLAIEDAQRGLPSCRRMVSTNRCEYRPERGSSWRRSTTSRIGHPARSSERDASMTRSAAARASSDGQGEMSTQGTPARRARSIATSRACHVGTRSSFRPSSCSSSTTIASKRGTDAHTADRRPSTTNAFSNRGNGAPGGTRITVTPGAGISPRDTRAVALDAVSRMCTRRPAQRHDAHRARSSTSGDSPPRDTIAIGLRTTPAGAATSMAVTHARTRRPCSATRTMPPTRTWSRISPGPGSRTPCRRARRHPGRR